MVLHLNTLDTESRAAYREALVTYFSRYHADLSEKSRERLQKPAAYFGSEGEAGPTLIAEAPAVGQYLNDVACFFDAVRDGLKHHGIPYTVNSRLVRGLDYYRHTVFEYVTESLGLRERFCSGAL